MGTYLNRHGSMKNPKMIHFKNVEKFEIDFGNIENQSEMPQIPFSFDRLKSITIESPCCKINAEFLKFIKQQPNFD